MVTEFKTKIDLAREMLDVLKERFRWPGSSSTPVLSEKLMTDNVVSELKSNRAQGRPQGPSRRWRDTSEWDNLESTTPT